MPRMEITRSGSEGVLVRISFHDLARSMEELTCATSCVFWFLAVKLLCTSFAQPPPASHQAPIPGRLRRSMWPAQAICVAPDELSVAKQSKRPRRVISFPFCNPCFVDTMTSGPSVLELFTPGGDEEHIF